MRPHTLSKLRALKGMEVNVMNPQREVTSVCLHITPSAEPAGAPWNSRQVETFRVLSQEDSEVRADILSWRLGAAASQWKQWLGECTIFFYLDTLTVEFHNQRQICDQIRQPGFFVNQ